MSKPTRAARRGSSRIWPGAARVHEAPPAPAGALASSPAAMRGRAETRTPPLEPVLASELNLSGGELDGAQIEVQIHLAALVAAQVCRERGAAGPPRSRLRRCA